MLYTIAAVLVALWLLGLFLHVLGAFIHVLLVIAVIVIAYKLVTGKSGAL